VVNPFRFRVINRHVDNVGVVSKVVIAILKLDQKNAFDNDGCGLFYRKRFEPKTLKILI